MPCAVACFAACVAAEAMRYFAMAAAAPQALAQAQAQAQVTLPGRPGGTPAHLLKVPRLKLNSSSLIPAAANAPSAHASTLAVLPNGELLVVWWAGARESAPDVAIYAATWHDGRWSPARRVLTREQLGEQLGFGVRRLGNPAVWVAGDGRIHLYVVATGLGGWAASRIVQMVSNDQAAQFSVVRVLPLSPLLNTSVLVRTPPIELTHGGWLLPAYFELGNKYPLVVAFSADGTPAWTRRIGRSTTSLQPTLVPVSATELHALMRDNGAQRRVQQAISVDMGRTWRDLPAAELINHDNSMVALRLTDGGYVLVHNDTLAPPATPRQWLRLSTSSDAMHWTAAPDVRRGAPGEEFSYPSAVQIGRQLHLTYTAQRAAIGHAVFDILTAGDAP